MKSFCSTKDDIEKLTLSAYIYIYIHHMHIYIIIPIMANVWEINKKKKPLKNN